MGSFKYFIRLFVFWLLYFLVNRVFFIVSYFEEFSKLNTGQLLEILPNSLALDLSFISYLSVIIVLLLFVNSVIISRKFNIFISRLVYLVNGFFLVISALIIGGEISLYKEWNTKLNFTALSHFINPSEVFLTATYWNYFTMLIAILISVLFLKFYRVLVHKSFISDKYNYKEFVFKVIRLPLVLGLLLLLIRGGWKEIPVNLSDAYFSNNIILNDVAVNPNWNLVQNVIKNKRNFTGNPYKKYSQAKLDKFINDLKDIDGSEISVLNKEKPNIVFIILESWSADNIESLGGLKGVTPAFKNLEKNGLLFTNFFSNGWTSDQAMTSIFSSFPVFPYVAIINQTDKARMLPCLSKSLSDNEYHTSYFFGGQLTYGNIKGYLLSQGFDLVKDEEDYTHLPSGKLGIHDEYMFSEFKNELNNLPQPFMSSLLTISSHSPFDFPGTHDLSFNSKEDKYVNSVAYTDKSLGNFISSVKNEKWYSNTLFIILADHSHNSPIKRRLAEKERFKIPMLWYGDVLNDTYKGKVCDKLSSHIDISPTILDQLGYNNAYEFGSNIFNSNQARFVPYAFPKGYGLISNEGYYAFSEGYSKVLELHANDSLRMRLIKEEAEMYFQLAFDSYLGY